MNSFALKRTRFLVAVSVIAMLMLGVAPVQAANNGGKCTKVGSSVTVGGRKLVCSKKGKSLVWVVAPKSGGNNTGNAGGASSATWSWNEQASKWVSSGTVPSCIFPIIASGSFIDLGSAISKDQPGQTRGGSYKPHGTVRWSTQTYKDNVSVTMPFDATVVTAWHFLVGGVYQFGFNAIAPCGIMLRIGHMHRPSVTFDKILATLSPAVQGDSREFPSKATIKKGDLIATAVGIPTGSPDEVGAFIDLAILDLRSKNPKLPSSFSPNADRKYAEYSVCWYEGNYLATADRTIVAGLPYSNGDATSDYCQK